MAVVPQHDLDAERAVISAVLLGGAPYLDRIRDLVAPEDCHSEAHRRILQAAISADVDGAVVDVVTVATRLRAGGHLEAVGGSSGLNALIDCTPSVANIEHHAAIVRGLARQRNLVQVCQIAAAEGHAPQPDVEGWLQKVQARVCEASDPAPNTRSAALLADIAPALARKINEAQQTGATPGHPSFLRTLTSFTGGYKDRFYVVAGRPGMGKSSFLLQECLGTALRGEGAIFVSAEMDAEELGLRLVSLQTQIPANAIMGGRLDDARMSRVMTAAEALRKLPLAIEYMPGATIYDIRSAVRRRMVEIRRRHGANIALRMVAVDYLQVLSSHRERGSREAEVADLSRGLMAMPKELGCPVLAGSQLNRSVESRNSADKRPQLSDLRESGAIEQDAYGVLMLYRDDYYRKDSPDPGTAEILVRKMRGGRTGTVNAKFAAEWTRFDDLMSESDEMAARERDRDDHDWMDENGIGF